MKNIFGNSNKPSMTHEIRTLFAQLSQMTEEEGRQAGQVFGRMLQTGMPMTEALQIINNGIAAGDFNKEEA